MTSDDWREGWQDMPQERRDRVAELLNRHADLIPGWQDGAIPTPEQLATLSAWQGLAAEVLTAYSDWLARTKALFERRGWPWTTAELPARSYIREVGE